MLLLLFEFKYFYVVFLNFKKAFDRLRVLISRIYYLTTLHLHTRLLLKPFGKVF